MVRFRCPHCSASITHKPHLAGSLVTCSNCGGEFYEPTDPLPGVRPEVPAPAPAIKSPPAKPPAPASAGAARPSDKLEPDEMVAELKRRGIHALMVYRQPANPLDVNVTFSDNMTRDEAHDMIVQYALHIMRTKWPELHDLAMTHINKPGLR